MGREKDRPPAYSADEAPSTSRSEPTQQHISHPDFSLYGIPKLVLIRDQTKRTVTDPDLCNDPQALARFCETQLSLPPLPRVRIRSKLAVPAVFDIEVDISPLIYLTGSAAWNHVKWIRKFCEDPAPLKSFTLERQVENWDTEFLQTRLRALVSSTKYPGNFEVSFPQAHSTVIVQTREIQTTLGNVISSLFHRNSKTPEVKKYNVVTAFWPYASTLYNGDNDRVVAMQSESAWWNQWKDTMRYAILYRRLGWVTAEDRMEVALDPRKSRGQFSSD